MFHILYLFCSAQLTDTKLSDAEESRQKQLLTLRSAFIPPRSKIPGIQASTSGEMQHHRPAVKMRLLSAARCSATGRTCIILVSIHISVNR